MTQTVTAEDGTIHNFPDEATPEMISGALGLGMSASDKLSDASKSFGSGAEASPFWLGDMANQLTKTISGTGADLYESLVGDLSPEQAEAAANPKLPFFSSSEAYNAAGAPLYEPKTGWGTAANIAGNMVGAGAVNKLPSAIGAVKEAGGQGIIDLLKNQATGNPDALPTPKILPPEYDHVATHSAISDSYGAAKEAVKPYYKLMNHIAEGETANASNLKPAIDSMIEDIQSTPFHEAASELPYLKQQSAKIGEDGTMPLSDMVKLRQNLNSNFNPKRFMQGSDTPYAQVAGIVDNSLTDAAKRIPEFGEAKSLADKNWLNTVKAPFEDNKVLQKFWKPEDYYAKRSVDNGMLEELPDPTMQRATTMVQNIKNPVQLNAVRRVLPQAHADALSQAKIQHITQGEGVGRLGAAGKVIAKGLDLTPTGLANTARNIGNVIKPRYTPEQSALIEAAKTPSPTLSTKYQQPFQNLNTKVNGTPYGPQQMLALPAPATVYVAPRGPIRGARPLSPEEAAAGKAMYQEYQDMGLDANTMAAQEAARRSQYARENPASTAFNDLRGNQSPISTSETALHEPTSGLSKDATFPEKNGMEGQDVLTPEDAAETMSPKVQPDMYAGIRNKVANMRKDFADREFPILDARKNKFEGTENWTRADDAKWHAFKARGYAKGGIVKNRENALSKKLKEKLGREPKKREIELATYVGPHGVHRLLKQKDSELHVHKMFPKELSVKHKELFFNKKKPYTVGQMKAVISS